MHVSGRPVVFTHIPKTAGTSLRRALRDVLAEPCVEGYDRSMFGAFDDWASIRPDMLAGVDHADDGHLFIDDPSLVCGHFAAAKTRARYPDAEHLTVLREGRTRILSLWLFWRAFPVDGQRAWGTWGERTERAHGTLVEFLDDAELSCLTDNVAVRCLLWPHRLIPDECPIHPMHDDALIEEAATMLGCFDFVDVVENPEWVANLNAWLGATLDLPHENATPPPPAELRGELADHLTDAAVTRLTELSRLDNRLWRVVAERAVRHVDAGVWADARFAAYVARMSLRLAGFTPSGG